MIRLGRVEITGGFFLLVAWLNYLDGSSLLPMAALACGVHELGHYLTIRLMGGDIKAVRLTAIGAEMVLAGPLSYWQEGLSALAGPGINLLLAMVCCREGSFFFAGLNLALALFNLLPAGRLDGGRALYCTLALLAGPNLAERTVEVLGGLCTFGLLTAGLMIGQMGNLTLLLVTFWMAMSMLRQNNSEIGLASRAGNRYNKRHVSRTQGGRR